LENATGAPPQVIVCYPWIEPWVRDVPPERLVYYNLDEYTLYRPERADTLREQEARLVNRAGTTVCLSRFQVEQLRERHPERANRIHHFPLGVRASFLNESSAHPPEPNTVVYIGNVGDRVDWGFFDAVASRCPDLTFRIVGGPIPEKASEDWERRRRTVVGRPNVEAIGRVPQDEVPAYYQRHAVNWIPYDLDHPFNRASCPTKIMDGLASGRSVASTSVPECMAYPQWIDLADDPDDMAEVLKRSAAPDAHDPERSRRQVAFAREHVWSERAETFERLLRTSDMEGATPASP
jgi:glycosyltransferase involved in cell wall biosynthesis